MQGRAKGESRLGPGLARTSGYVRGMTLHPSEPRIAILGAGLSGLVCGAQLRDAGYCPVVYEKSRGLGGRLATRRGPSGAFDHGAQYITARSPRFREFLERLVAAGAAAHWSPKGRDGAHPWYVGTPGMSALVRPLADGLDIRQPARVTAVRQTGDLWHLEFEDGAQDGPFDQIISTLPAPQSAVLLAKVPGIDALSQVKIHPCWALMLSLSRPPEGGPDSFRPEAGPIAWAARDSSKPGRAATTETWIVHATPDWSKAHLERDPAEVIELLTPAFISSVGPTSVTAAAAHRWRYAMTARALGQPVLSLAQDTLLVGGDWTLGARVEAAYESGLHLAERAISRLKPRQASWQVPR